MKLLIDGNKAFLLSALILGGWLTLHYTIGRDPAKMIIDSLVVGAAAGISYSWFRPFTRKLKEGMADSSGNIIISTWMLWTLMLFYFLWVVFNNQMGADFREHYLRPMPISGIFSVGFFLAASYALLTPINDPGPVAARTIWHVLIATAIGFFVAGGIVGYWLFSGMKYGG